MFRPSKMTGAAHQLPHPAEIGLAKLVPLRHDRERVGAGQRGVAVVRVSDLGPEDAARHFHRLGIVGLHRRASREQAADERNRGRFAHVVRLRLERQAPDGDALALHIAEVRVHLLEEQPRFWCSLTDSTERRIWKS